MEFEKLSVILTEDQEKNLNKLDWFLIVADREIEKIKAFFERLELLDNQNQDTHKTYKELIFFKIRQIYHLIIDLEQNIYNSSIDYYLQHFGLYKNKNRFLEIKEMDISYQFESLLTQLKSLIDFFLKYVWEIRLKNKINKMDSFEYITKQIEELSFKKYRTDSYKRAKTKITILRKEKILNEFFKNYDAFYNLKNYRDYIIHRGRIKQDKSVSQADRYIQFSYYIPEINIIKREYNINDTHQYRLDFFCRVRFLELVYIIWRTLNNLIKPEQLKRAKEDIKSIKIEEIKKVLEYLGRKIMWNDKSFMEKDDVEKFLEKMDLKFSDLVVDREIKERQMEGHKSAMGEDMSYLLERTIYKPIKGFQFQRVRFNYDRDWKPEKEMDTYGFVRSSFTLDDIRASKENIQKILNNFIKLGLVIKIEENEEVRYEFIEEELQHYIAMLLSLSQYKWSFIKHPQMQYFRKRKLDEISNTKEILSLQADEYMIKEDVEREKIQNEYKIYKERQKAWIKFKKEHNLDVKTFKKNSLNYHNISLTLDTGLYKEIREKWSEEYNKEGYFDIMNKEGNQVIDRIGLLDYLHEINTNFKNWKRIFKGKKLNEVKKLAKKIFHKKKEHWLDLQKRWLKEHKIEYIKMLEKERERFSKMRRKYAYLNQVLKLINKDFFSKKLDLS